MCVHVLKSTCWDLCGLGSHTVRELSVENRKSIVFTVRSYSDSNVSHFYNFKKYNSRYGHIFFKSHILQQLWYSLKEQIK